MATPTNQEQELLEYINRARMNPRGEFDALIADAARGLGVTTEITNGLRYFGVDLDSLRAQFAALTPAAPLAWNEALARAAVTHNKLMIKFDEQSHMLPGESGHLERVIEAGYNGARAVGENVYAYGESILQAHAAFFIDWGQDTADFGLDGRLLADWQTRGDGIQDPPGHRNTLMDPRYTEIGVGVTPESNTATKVGPILVTQELATRASYRQQLLGVIYDDDNGNRFYDAGEGLEGVTITARGAAGNFTTTSWSSGGYQMELPPGSYTVSFSSPILPGTGVYNVTITEVNYKLDVIADEVSPGPASDIPSTPGNDWLAAGTTGITINGGAGVDMVSFVDLGERVVVDLGTNTATAGAETWGLYNVENVTGTIWSDLIIGDAGDNRLRGLGGYDWFVGSDGNDTYEGGTGRDTISYALASALPGGVGVHANLQFKKGLKGQAEGDVYDSIESLTGSSHKDWLVGSDEANVLRGLAGDDIIYGYGGNDTIDGGPGNDWLDGGDGNDRITGGSGNDTIVGGRGWDTALYSGQRADYRIETWANGWVSVFDTRGIDGADILIDMNVIEFADGKLWL